MQTENKNSRVNPSMGFLFSHPAHFAGLGFGSGMVPVAPGTFGTLAAIPLWLLMADLAFGIQCVVIFIAGLVGIYFCGKTAEGLGVHDHGAIVWDEFVGYWVTMLFAPAGWVWVLIGFLLFRFFDILKPWPIRVLDKKVHGGFGIMVDDVLAGVFAGVVIQIVLFFL